MNEYIIYFEFFSKKMKTSVFANTRNEAVMKVRNKINIIKVNKKSDPTVEFLKDMFNIG